MTSTKHPERTPLEVRIVGSCDVALWGLHPVDRLRRILAPLGIDALRDESDVVADSASVILLRADVVLEEVLVKALVNSRNVVLVLPSRDGGRQAVAAHVPGKRAEEAAAWLRGDRFTYDVAPLTVLDPAGLGSTYNHALRKRAVPYALSLREHAPTAVEQRMFDGAYKGVTDFVTKWLWPRPAFLATRWCATRGITPNAVTAASLVLVLVTTWLFASGYFIAGAIAAWLMTFLDTVDGKLARVTLTSTKFGNVFDHGIDLIHPPFWYWAWWYGLSWMMPHVDMPLLTVALWINVGGYVLGRAQEGLFLWLAGIEMHAWRPVDSAFRLITARRNPNLALLTLSALFGRPDLGFVAIAVWTVASLLFHFVRIAQAARLRRTGIDVRSWLQEPVPDRS